MAFLKIVMSPQVSVEDFRRFGVNLCAESLPESLMLMGWAREQEVIYVHDQEESHLAKEEARRMRRDGYSAQLDDNLFKMSFPVSFGFRVAIESLLQKQARSL